MKALHLFILSIVLQSSFGQEVIDWIDKDLLKQKNVQSVKVWKINSSDKEDLYVFESIYFNEHHLIDSIIDVDYNEDGSKYRLKHEYKYDDRDRVVNIMTSKNGQTHLKEDLYFEGDKLTRRVVTEAGKDLSYSENFYYYPNGLLSKKVENHVKTKIMKSYLYKYNEKDQPIMMIGKYGKVTFETVKYEYLETGDVKTSYFDKDQKVLKTKFEKYNDKHQIQWYEKLFGGNYLKWEFEYYKNDLIKILKRYTQKGSTNKYYFELEYQFFE